MDNITSEQVNQKLKELDNYNDPLDEMVIFIVDKYCGELDEYMDGVNRALINYSNKKVEIPISDLESIITNLAMLLYYANSSLERVGLKSDSAKVVEKYVYHKHREHATGTVQDKNTYADLKTQPEKLSTLIYERSYRLIKLKIDSGYELLSSMKKVLSSRMLEKQISRSSFNRKVDQD